MYKKFIVAIGILIALTLGGGTVGPLTGKVLAHGHGPHHCCGDCGHFLCPGDCRKCEECLARQRAAKAAKCEKCGHEECPGNCKRCVDCLAEKIEKLERGQKGEKED